MWSRVAALCAVVAVASCSDGTGPRDRYLVELIEVEPFTEELGAIAFATTVRVTNRTGDPVLANVSWEASHGDVLAPAVTDEEGFVRGLWQLDRNVVSSGTSLSIRACARARHDEECSYSESISRTMP